MAFSAAATSAAAAAATDSSSPRYSNASSSSSPIIPHRAPCTLLRPPSRTHHTRRHHNPLRLLRSICRTLPIFTTPRCGLPHSISSVKHSSSIAGGGARARVTGTLFGQLRGRVSLCIQESPCSLPWAVIEMAVQTQALMHEMGAGMVRIALECESSAVGGGAARNVMEEGMWGLFYNGRKSGYAVRREATDEDLALMELLRAVSMGAGVLPDSDHGRGHGSGGDGEVAYMRAYFEHVAGSRDSETLYLLSPVDDNGPELSIFFVRI